MLNAMLELHETITGAVKEAVSQPVSLEDIRHNYLRCWFAPENSEKLVRFYAGLGDQASREVFLKLLRFTICQLFAGNMEKYLFFSNAEWHGLEEKAKTVPLADKTNIGEVIQTFILEGYSYGNICAAVPGDTVLDIGAWTGNTALYFVQKVGPEGRVIAFEPMPETGAKLASFIKNSGNGNIEAEPFAVSDRRKTLNFTSRAWSASRAINGPGLEIQAVSIDEYCADKSLGKVDFIKMDIEGGEKDALSGGRETIRKFQPKLAISIYHLADDFIRIPELITSIYPGYKFYLKHNYNNFSETVLFAVAENRVGDNPVHAISTSPLNREWEMIASIHAARKTERRKIICQRFVEFFNLKYEFPIKAILDETSYYYAYYPLSADGRLHYELLIGARSIETAIHFEGKYAHMNQPAHEIVEANNFQLPLRTNTCHLTGCSYSLPLDADMELVAGHMKNLIDISLPILRRAKLLPDELSIKLAALGWL